MQRFTATLVENKCKFLTILWQQKLAQVMIFKTETDKPFLETTALIERVLSRSGNNELVFLLGDRLNANGECEMAVTARI